MNWKIPPIGCCARCLLKDDDYGKPVERAAWTLVNGTALCRDHAREMYNQPST